MIPVCILLFPLFRRIQVFLQNVIECFRTECALAHRRQHLNICRLCIHIPWQLVSDQLHHVFINDIHVISFQEKEILTAVVQRQHFAPVNSVRIHDNIAFLCLPEYFLQHNCRKTSAVNEIVENLPGPHAWKL